MGVRSRKTRVSRPAHPRQGIDESPERGSTWARCMDFRSFEQNHPEERLGKSRSPIKTLLMDQHRVAGLGNIYVNESLFRAGIHPEQSGCALSEVQWQRLFDGIRGALDEAFTHGRSCSLDWQGSHQSDGFFYFLCQSNNRSKKEERFRVYDRAHQPCLVCQAFIEKMQIAGRSAYYCPGCQSL